MLAATCPLRPTVTRFPGSVMVPSILPSMYSDSEPETSPLMTSDLPMVACSPAGATATAATEAEGRADSKLLGDGAEGRVGSGVEGVVGPAWFGFHMGRLFPFRFTKNG